MRASLLFVFSLLAIAPLAAPLLAGEHPLAALLIRDFFAAVCHQQVARSFVIEGSPVAVCVRCLGIYCGLALGTLSLLPIGRRVLALTMLFNLMDLTAASLHWHGNLPVVRFYLGLLLGLSAGAVLVSGEWRVEKLS